MKNKFKQTNFIVNMIPLSILGLLSLWIFLVIQFNPYIGLEVLSHMVWWVLLIGLAGIFAIVGFFVSLNIYLNQKNKFNLTMLMLNSITAIIALIGFIVAAIQ